MENRTANKRIKNNNGKKNFRFCDEMERLRLDRDG